jgi:hypothetical protein
MRSQLNWLDKLRSIHNPLQEAAKEKEKAKQYFQGINGFQLTGWI